MLPRPSDASLDGAARLVDNPARNGVWTVALALVTRRASEQMRSPSWPYPGGFEPFAPALFTSR